MMMIYRYDSQGNDDGDDIDMIVKVMMMMMI